MGAEWGEIGGEGGKREIGGIAHMMWVVEGCGRMWLKMGQKRERNGTKYPFFTVPFFRRSKVSLTVPLCKTQPTALTDGKMGISATQRHSPPLRMGRTLDSATKFMLPGARTKPLPPGYHTAQASRGRYGTVGGSGGYCGTAQTVSPASTASATHCTLVVERMKNGSTTACESGSQASQAPYASS